MRKVGGQVIERVDPKEKCPDDLIQWLSLSARRDLSLLVVQSSVRAHSVLFTENEQPSGIYIIVDGAVKLSVSSAEGKRLNFRIAQTGELLGLSATISEKPHEFTAETLYRSEIALISRHDVLLFLMRHPEAYRGFSQEQTREFTFACGRLRMFGLSATASAKLARLLLEWSDSGQFDKSDMIPHLSITHEQIGEFIGASRETVSRILAKFRNRQLVAFDGSTLTIPDRSALVSVAGY